MEGRESRPAMESPLQRLSPELRLHVAERIIQQHENMLQSALNIAKESVRKRQDIIEHRGTPLEIHDLSMEVEKAVISTTQQWYSWLKNELFHFDVNETKAALEKIQP